MSWIEDQNRFEQDGTQPAFRSKSRHVPKSYRLDLEFVCYTNAENLAKANPKLQVVYGLARLKGDKSKDAWGEHAWCKTKRGVIVDPYFEWKFPNEVIEYKETNDDYNC